MRKLRKENEKGNGSHRRIGIKVIDQEVLLWVLLLEVAIGYDISTIHPSIL